PRPPWYTQTPRSFFKVACVRTGRSTISSPDSSTSNSSPASSRSLSRRSLGKTTRPALSTGMALMHTIMQWQMPFVNGIDLFCGFRQQVGEVLLPEDGPGMGAVAVRLFAQRDQDVLAVLQPLGFALRDAQLRRIDEVVRRIHPRHSRRDLFQIR